MELLVSYYSGVEFYIVYSGGEECTICLIVFKLFNRATQEEYS